VKTFSSTISGSIDGNAATVTNGVYTTGDQTIGGTKTFSNTISGSVSGTAGNVTGTVAVANGGTGSTDAANARVSLGLGSISTQSSSGVAITGGSINGTEIGGTTAAAVTATTLTSSSLAVTQASTATAAIAITATSGTYPFISFDGSGTTLSGIAGDSGNLQFRAGGIASGDTAVTILSSGNVGIGASNPGNKLVVGGGALTSLAAVTFSATAMTVDCTLSNVFVTTLTGSVTTAPSITNPGNGQNINWFITQDSVGSRTMVWPTSFKWPGGVDGVLSTAPNAEDLLVATYRSATTSWYATLAKDFKA
jgi:hypothetical protein